jgi:hypothetical protein
LIAVDDALLTVQWASLFMRDQRYDLETIIKEDNRSTMLLMKNGRLSLGKRTKHLDIIQGKRIQLLGDIILNRDNISV